MSVSLRAKTYELQAITHAGISISPLVMETIFLHSAQFPERNTNV